MTTIQTQVTSTSDQDRAIATLTAGFISDPIGRWVWRDSQRYLTYFPPFVKAFAGSAFAARSAHEVEGFAGVALWLPPGSGSDDDAMIALAQESVPEAEQEEVFGFLEQMPAHHPQEPHWYLPLIAVDPVQQGCGYGSALLRHALEQCDQARLPAYLEATSPRSKPLYQRHGFEETGVIQVGSSPPMWPMRREPR